MNNKLLFHYLSYLQYPLLVGVVYYSYEIVTQSYPEILNLNALLKDMNSLLIMMGLAVSFATLQDAQKVSMKFESKIWENPKLGKIMIRIIMTITLLFLAFGVFGFFITKNENLKEIAIGLIVLGIGLIGMAKAATEIFENHRKDEV